MFWIDNTTLILKDKSIVNFQEDGYTEMYPSKQWLKPRGKFKSYHSFRFHSKKQAIDVFTLINNSI